MKVSILGGNGLNKFVFLIGLSFQCPVEQVDSKPKVLKAYQGL